MKNQPGRLLLFIAGRKLELLTIREYTESKRTVLVLAEFLVPVFALPIFFLSGNRAGIMVVLVAAAFSTAAIVAFSMYGLRCPNCGKNLGHMLAGPITPFWMIPDGVTECPFCGIDLDTKIADVGKGN